jgi:hypothetical protein
VVTPQGNDAEFADDDISRPVVDEITREAVGDNESETSAIRNPEETDPVFKIQTMRQTWLTNTV